MPKLGVYAVLCHIDGLTYRGVLNYGKKPTFQQGLLPLMEVHLLDQQLDLYEKRMTLEFVTYLRAEQKFSSLDELKGQISKDADQARAILTARS